MSFKARDVTQGGQVTFMRWRMFLQINNILTYYLVIFLFFITTSMLFIHMSLQNIKNGLFYWYSVSLHPLQSHMVKKPVYHLEYYGKKLSYTTDQIINDPYTIYCGQLLRQELFICFNIGLVSVISLAAFFFWYLGYQGKKQREDEVTGGRILSEEPQVIARLMKKRGHASDIRIDKLPMIKGSEIQNFAMHGSVGTGKSQLIRKFLEQCRERGDMVILYDKGCTFVREFYDPAIDELLNPFDKRCAYWDLWEECPALSDLETAANTLIPMGASEDPFWQGSSRTIFAEGTNRLRDDPNRSYNKLLRTLLAINLDQLRELLAGTPASTLVDGKIEKTAISIRSVLTNYVKALRYLQGIEKSGKPKFTIRKWMQEVNDDGKNGWLFITSNQQYHESLKPVISMWLSIAANNLMSMGENLNRRVWIWIDELRSLHKLTTLPDAIAEMRKFGGCFGLGFQSYPQLEEIYGPKAAEAMFDLMNTKFFFRSPSAAVAKFVEKELGETVLKRFSEQTSFGNDEVRDGVSFGKDEKRISVASYTDVMKLDNLGCYITLPGDYPVIKMSLKYVSRKAVAEEFIPRIVQESLDEQIELEIVKRVEEESQWRALFDGHTAVTTSSPTTLDVTGSNDPLRNALPVSDSSDRKPSQSSGRKQVSTSENATAPAGGRSEELKITDVPTPITLADTEILQSDYQLYIDEQQTRDAVRKEEVNINHRRGERDQDLGDFTL